MCFPQAPLSEVRAFIERVVITVYQRWSLMAPNASRHIPVLAFQWSQSPVKTIPGLHSNVSYFNSLSQLQCEWESWHSGSASEEGGQPPALRGSAVPHWTGHCHLHLHLHLRLRAWAARLCGIRRSGRAASCKSIIEIIRRLRNCPGDTAIITLILNYSFRCY